jgi:hypothetical protein
MITEKMEKPTVLYLIKTKEQRTRSFNAGSLFFSPLSAFDQNRHPKWL